MNNTMSVLSITTISFKSMNKITKICCKRQIIWNHKYWTVNSAGNKNGVMRKRNTSLFFLQWQENKDFRNHCMTFSLHNFHLKDPFRKYLWHLYRHSYILTYMWVDCHGHHLPTSSLQCFFPGFTPLINTGAKPFGKLGILTSLLITLLAEFHANK